MIEVGSGNGTGTGSGFVLDRQGHVMTNNHVVAGAAGGSRIRVVFADGRQTTATLVGRSPSYDLAVIKVEGRRPAPPARRSATRAGRGRRAGGRRRVAARACPARSPRASSPRSTARSRSASPGSADAPDGLHRRHPDRRADQPGQLRRPAGRRRGPGHRRQLGDPHASAGQGQAGNIGIGFAIPINQARTIGDLLIKDGKATYPVVGAQLRETARGRRAARASTPAAPPARPGSGPATWSRASTVAGSRRARSWW